MELHNAHHFEVSPTMLLCKSISVHIYSLKSGRNFTSASTKINVFLYAPLSRNERKWIEGNAHTDDQICIIVISEYFLLY